MISATMTLSAFKAYRSAFGPSVSFCVVVWCQDGAMRLDKAMSRAELRELYTEEFEIDGVIVTRITAPTRGAFYTLLNTVAHSDIVVELEK